MLMTRFVAGDWFLGLMGGMLIPMSLGLIIRARRQMLSEIKKTPEKDSND